MSTQNITVIGLQWGDEGKGKIVDLLARNCRYVVRYCGGANAGHTVIVAGERYPLHLIPSGILHKGVHNIVANGVAFDPVIALQEIETLRERGVTINAENLSISSSANVVMPYHKLADRLSEQSLGAGKIGTTALGIGPCYSDKALRSLAIRVADLLAPETLKEKIGRIVEIKSKIFKSVFGYDEPIDAEGIWREYCDYGKRLEEMITDTGAILRSAWQKGERICFEGGQGSMLDIDHGTFPYVTSSSVTACGVPAGAGVPPKAVGRVIGVIKAYTSRVGAGPFPTEQDNQIGQYLREHGKEYGTTTGRPRRCGWFDAVAVKYAADLSCVDELALTLLDVLGGLETIKICTEYRFDDDKAVQHLSIPMRMSLAKCVYEELPGWDEQIEDVRSFSDLPANARAYVQRIEELIGKPVGLISIGPQREQVIKHNTGLDDIVI